MYELILLDKKTGRRLVWRMDTLHDQLEVANVLMTLPTMPVVEEAQDLPRQVAS